MFCSPRGARKRQQFMDYITSKGDITSKHLIKCMMLCESIFWVYTYCARHYREKVVPKDKENQKHFKNTPCKIQLQ